MERTVKLTLSSERGYKFVANGYHCAAAASTRVDRPRIRSSLHAKSALRTPSEVPATGRQIKFSFFSSSISLSRERNKRKTQETTVAHHLKKNRLTSTKNRHDREERGIFFFCHMLHLYIIYIFNLSAILRGLCTKNKKVDA